MPGFYVGGLLINAWSALSSNMHRRRADLMMSIGRDDEDWVGVFADI